MRRHNENLHVFRANKSKSNAIWATSNIKATTATATSSSIEVTCFLFVLLIFCRVKHENSYTKSSCSRCVQCAFCQVVLHANCLSWNKLRNFVKWKSGRIFCIYIGISIRTQTDKWISFSTKISPNELLRWLTDGVGHQPNASCSTCVVVSEFNCFHFSVVCRFGVYTYRFRAKPQTRVIELNANNRKIQWMKHKINYIYIFSLAFSRADFRFSLSRVLTLVQQALRYY